jgi:ketosteroid isomerase-like protein
MSDRKVELARRAIAAFNARDIEAMIAYFDPNDELHAVYAAVGGAIYHGHDGLRKYFRDLEHAWGAELRLEPESFFDLGEQPPAFQAVYGRGRHSGAEVAMPAARVATCRDDLIVHFKGSTDREVALTDLGVSEDELEPIDP